MNLDKVFIWLSMSDMPIKKLYDFALSYDNLEDLWNINRYDNHIMQFLDGNEFQELITLRDGGKLDKMLNHLENSKIKYVTLFSPNYPKCFHGLEVPPFIIYYIGDLSLLNMRCFTIVGSRVCTRYGVEQTERFASAISKAGFAIVSGLAEGIDGHAHEGTLAVNGKAIGVLAGGLDYIYPAINVQLARNIVESGGVILSEKAPDVNPKNFTFVQRNRLIAAIGEGILITEAGAKSGALHTVNFALDLGKELFVIPGNINSKSSEGSNELIKQFYCSCVTKPEEVISVLNQNYVKTEAEQKPKVEKTLRLSDLEQKVVSALENGEQHFDEILEKTQIPTKNLLGLLTTMEIRGLIKKLPSNFYELKEK